MRGSVYHQTAVLTKIIYVKGAKKEEKTDPAHKYYQHVSSYKTMEVYRNVWNNFFNYLKEHWSLKNCELISDEHVQAYFEYKIEYYPSEKYAKKISSALGKLETALNKYSMATREKPTVYCFNIRQKILNRARDYELVANNYRNRTYQNPLAIINNLSNSNHKLAAIIQLEGGARAEGVGLIKKEQLHGYKIDDISKDKKGILETKEKGGKIGDIILTPQTYQKLENYFSNSTSTIFRINYQQYEKDIKNACALSGETMNGSHGFRWTFAQNRVREYQRFEYSYEQAIQGVSWEMKHYRASITEHYLG